MFAEIGEFVPGMRKPREFVCDTVADVANLPECIPGSTAVVVTGEVYIVNAQGEWVVFGG